MSKGKKKKNPPRDLTRDAIPRRLIGKISVAKVNSVTIPTVNLSKVYSVYDREVGHNHDRFYNTHIAIDVVLYSIFSPANEAGPKRVLCMYRNFKGFETSLPECCPCWSSQLILG